MRTTEPRRPASDTRMEWWRFSAYEVRDRFVRPRPGSALQRYDPADDADGDLRTVPPYQALLHLYNELSRGNHLSEDGDDVDETGAAAIARWCSEHGLLGILPHRLYAAVLAPRWVSTDGERGSAVEQVEYVRADDEVAFASRRHRYGAAPRRRSGADGGTLSAAERRKYGTKAPGVVLYDPDTRNWGHEQLRRTWVKFFPTVYRDPESFDYPQPLSDAFWSVYAEPTDLFLQSASKVWSAALHVSGKPTEMGMRLALHDLRPLTQPAGVVIRHSEGHSCQRVWTSPSLLGWLALRIADDLAEHARARLCRTCQTPFLSSAYQAMYCSERCRGTWNMRLFRRRGRRIGKGASKARSKTPERARPRR